MCVTREDQLDELLDAYDEAFNTLPVYKKNNVMKKMNTVDSLARDVAFEIMLGGDRFDPDDLRAFLEGCSEGELNLFRDRIRYHAVDFGPKEARTEDFLSRMIDAWTRDIPVVKNGTLRQPFLDMSVRKERGQWFRFSDGQVLRCERAVTDAMWEKDVLDKMSPDSVPAVVVAKQKAFAFLSKYGEEMNLDGPVVTADILSYGSLSSGNVMSVRRLVDTLTEKPEDFVYYVTYKTPGGRSSTLLSHLTDEEMERFISILDSEEEYRLREGMAAEPLEPYILPEGTFVKAPEGVVPGQFPDSPFEAVSVFEAPDGDVMIAGRFTSNQGQVYNFRLADFSDKSLDIICRAQEKVLNLSVSQKKQQKESVRKAVTKSRGVD